MLLTADQNDIKNDLMNDLGLDETFTNLSLQKLVDGESRYLKDLRVNIKNVLKSDHITEKETALLAVAIATNQKNVVLQKFFVTLAEENEATDEEISDVMACASLLASNNVFYRFRHFMDKESYNKKQARIKMNIMARPRVEKEFFELTSLAVSAVNGCEMCCVSHEKSLLEMGTSEDRVFDAVRLASVLVSLDAIIR